ncbi:MAG: phosphatidate cytidylyltransferase [Gammaproteobacteria bacterium]|nr:phosphatidate cytidylyltransferase [Gammaproteobacteria bacterium]
MNKLLQRIITALVLLAIVLVIFFALPRAAAIGALGAFVVAASWEWARFGGQTGVGGRTAYASLTAGLLTATAIWVPQPVPLGVVMLIGLAWWVCAAILVARFPVVVSRNVAALAGFLVLLPAWVGLLALLRAPEGGPELVLYLLAIVWAADVGAYFAGRRFGRVKLAPAVSPGKTWEGAVGGLVAAALVAGLAAGWAGLAPAIMVPVGLSIALISILGDLTVSLFKRNAGLKDSGSLFPGHGGVLDRFDSVTAAVPLFVLQASWFRLLTL